MNPDITLHMMRPDLENLPDFALPLPFSFKTYAAGDEELWLDIHRQAEPHNDFSIALYEAQFGHDEDVLAQRQFFLLDGDDAAIGTATAWFDEDGTGQLIGRLHWVAIVPLYQGRGLAKPLLSTVCRRMRTLGHQRTVLTTSAEKIAAIHLYLKFGFVPDIRGAQDGAAWQAWQRKFDAA